MAKRQLDPFFNTARDSIPKPHAHGPVAGRIDERSRYSTCAMTPSPIINMGINNFIKNADFAKVCDLLGYEVSANGVL